ncbi:60S ribosomal protein L7 [Astathelohania contejeani]|uniref:60S ribosomal protein L7 n=1 Tax=Astathelohania contejeani TaxID=164912 RepID=A0ABQ7HXF4_9MICR|nr:60S ribosomal protein L7 [Thelohania contejeani]
MILQENEQPVSYLKAKEYQAKLDAIRKEQQHALALRQENNRKYAEKTTAKLIALYKASIAEEAEKKAEALRKNAIYVPKEAEFFLVVRIRGVNNVPPKERKIMELFRLNKQYSAVFVRNNKSIKQMLQKVRNYVAWGTIDIHLLRELIYKRGSCKINGKHANITSEVIEDAFDGELRCMEELVYHIYYGTPFFKAVNRFLWPFALQCPRGGFKGRKAKDFVMGGSTGNHYELIGELVKRMI